MTSGRAERYYLLLAFGADPTGRAPSDYAFRAAASAMGSGDAPLYLPVPPGTFRVSFPIDYLPAGASLGGVDPEACTITVDPEDFANFAYSYIVESPNPGLAIRDITFDGRKRDGANPANQCGLVAPGRDTTLERVHLKDPNYFGLWLGAGAVHVTVERCVSSLGGNNDSIGGGGATDVLIRRHRWKADTLGNLFDSVGGSGVVLDDCVADPGGSYGGIFFEGMTDSGIRNSVITGASLQSDENYNPSTVTNPLRCFAEHNRCSGPLQIVYSQGGSTAQNPGGENAICRNTVTEPTQFGIMACGVPSAENSSGGDLIVGNLVLDANASDSSSYNNGDGTGNVAGIVLNQAYRVLCADNVIIDTRSTPQQAYSIAVGGNTGAAADCTVARNFCRGSSGIGSLGAGDIAADNTTDCRIVENDTSLGVANYSNTAYVRNNGPAPGVSAPAVPAASASVTNDTGTDVDVYVAGGAGVSVSVGSVDTGLAGGSFFLPSGATINLGAYTTAPTWQWLPR